MHVLIIKTSSMGDILHTLPALTDAMHELPGIRFDWVVEEHFAQIPYWHPSVDKVIPVAIRRWRKNWFSNKNRKERLYFKNELQSREYDAVIDAQGLIKSAFLITRLSRGEKHGQNRHSIREPLATWWYDKHHHINKQQHAVERIREQFAKSLDYKKPKIEGNYTILDYFISSLSDHVEQYLIFLHSTTRTNKHWPESHWRELIEKIQPTFLQIKLPWGTEHEYKRALRLTQGFKNVEVLPRLTVEQLAKQLIGAHAVVSVDTGLSHLTAALNRPNITLYGPTNPKRIGVYGKNQIILISPSCILKDLKVDYVLSHLKSIIADNSL
ncbi:lipopolysaccharide heptosyltransferase RfaC [Pantoea sp. Aalb]|uniref:lipopolysaccharide heptosyltransferase RfaC n=1 Tax=Pantoea sp. Aalb TaxID=2576762 RepID=UPI0013206D42|nr:lipopolysaccharide heptosyltransferase RfaC [Pantoea sp. Aalb]MXP67937.1 lipopolysaccharide heptosyltransferase RfaC [Pantoea sp. Aalb]